MKENVAMGIPSTMGYRNMNHSIGFIMSIFDDALRNLL